MRARPAGPVSGKIVCAMEIGRVRVSPGWLEDAAVLGRLSLLEVIQAMVHMTVQEWLARPSGGERQSRRGAHYQITHHGLSRVTLPDRYLLSGKFFFITRSASLRRSVSPIASYAFTMMSRPSSFAGACG
jgi:hypothetical protein